VLKYQTRQKFTFWFFVVHLTLRKGCNRWSETNPVLVTWYLIENRMRHPLPITARLMWTSLSVFKAMSRANLILKSFHSRDRTLLTSAFCTYVRPLLEYCSPVWSPHTQCLINRIEKVQRHFTKRIAGLWSMSYDKRLRTLGLQSLEYRRVIYDLILYYKIKMAY